MYILFVAAVIVSHGVKAVFFGFFFFLSHAHQWEHRQADGSVSPHSSNLVTTEEEAGRANTGGV